MRLPLSVVHAFTHLARAAQLGKRADHLRCRHRDHLNGQRELAQGVHQFGFIGNAHKLVSQVGHDLFTGQSSTTAFDHGTLMVDLVGAVDVDAQAGHGFSWHHFDAQLFQALCAAHGTGHRTGDEGRVLLQSCAQCVDELVDR
jgi:hypothetical protein